MTNFKILSCVAFICIANLIDAQTNILSNDFQTGIPATYAIVDNDGQTPHNSVSEFTNAWISYDDPEDVANKVAASTSYFTSSNDASRWLITPKVALGAYGNFISWKGKSHDPSFNDDYLVLVSTTDSLIDSFTDTLDFVDGENDTWTTRTVNLSEKSLDNEDVYIAFVNVTNNGFKLYLDSISIWKEDPVGLNENFMNTNFNVYPNPCTEFVSIDHNSTIEKVEFIDFTGKVVLTELNNFNLINLSALNSGIYIVKVYDENSMLTKRIIKN